MHHDDRIRVVYPHGGRRVLLHWWTEDDRGHVIIANTERSAYATAMSVFEEHTDVEIKDYCEIDIVAPSTVMHARYAASQLDKRIFMFHREVISALHDVVAVGHALPAFFVPCETYVPDEDDADPDEWAREKHYDCKYCVEKIKLVGMTPSGMYSRWYEAWRAVHPVNEYVDPKKALSRAAVTDVETSLQYARPAFGPHASGIELCAWDSDCPNSDALFFFRRVRNLATTALQDVIDSLESTRTSRNEKREAERIAERERFERECIETTLTFFARRCR